ncbi:MAG: helix-turn-helix domain-containing protein [Eubacteriales bacterium]|nr:helix-turn-helix domain-containing protein [Eubacteriales bacterium]
MEYEEKIKWVLTTFFRTTQIEALYCDSQMNVSSCQFRRYIYEDFYNLSMGEIEIFLRDIFAKESIECKDSYTYYLRHNLTCNVSIVNTDGKCAGAIITQPVVLSTLKKDEIKLKYATLPPKERDACIAAISRAPTLSQDRIIPIASTLNSLVQYISVTTEFKPVVCGSETNPLSYKLMQPGKSFNRQHKSIQPSEFGDSSMYFKLKSAISKGDTETLLNFFDTIDLENIPADQYASEDILRSIKNYTIKGCAICSCFAIDAKAPYVKIRDFTRQVIREIESTNNINDLYNLARTAFKTFTRYVAVSQINGYSKYVRQATEYIENHYMEKITLESLSQITGTSKFHLSSLIKKDTGLSVTDIINRVRIEESKKLLIGPTMSLVAISSKVGFANRNYFTKVFKQHTGITPTEFSKAVEKSADKDAKSKDILRGLLEQLFHMMEVFPGVFSVGRIVDPIRNKAWMINPSGKILENKCYGFWSRKQSCDTCIAHIALNENKVFMKLDRRSDSLFFVLATPITIGETRVVLELMMKTEDNFFNCATIDKSDDITAEALPNG